ncbi:hypothetical protein [Subtercola boreus]|uniref:Uncharacterized protein n=1 Tax=Subtercola boreus TaxID=120213 RepID=A0A3E0WCD9_9MICO|nr:hypothetical protein [Subtercola boreus]RFA21023.1 hypothetical protein B7R24_06340 [Subtercola boreus]RFA21407.1 hypothetical protein B7R23_06285 [Subtercola boreus]RFA27378.1 hypothetical protein B7R25_06410 [Subtercola boreus]
MNTTTSARWRTTAARLGTTGLIVVGVALLAAGAVAVFVSTNAGGTAALIGAGVVLVVLGFFGDRVANSPVHADGRRQNEASGRAPVPRPAAPVSEDDHRRDGVGAQQPHGSASAQLTTENAPTPEIQAALNRGHALAKRPSLRRADVKKLYGDHSEDKRITALAITQKRPDLGSLEMLVESIGGSRSTFEQYQGLLTARAAVDAQSLTDEESTALRDEIRRQLTVGRITGTNRTRIAESILGS